MTSQLTSYTSNSAQELTAFALCLPGIERLSQTPPYSYLEADFQEMATFGNLPKVCHLFNQVHNKDSLWAASLAARGIVAPTGLGKATLVAHLRRYCTFFMDKEGLHPHDSTRPVLSEEIKKNIFLLYAYMQMRYSQVEIRQFAASSFELVGFSIGRPNGWAISGSNNVELGELEDFEIRASLEAGIDFSYHADILFHALLGNMLNVKCSFIFLRFLVKKGRAPITTKKVCLAMERGFSDEAIAFLVEQTKDQEKNPLNSPHLVPNLATALEKMVQKYPVTSDHIESALKKKYPESVLRLMLKQVKDKPSLGLGECMRPLFDNSYSDEFIIALIPYLSKVDKMIKRDEEYLTGSILKNHSMETINAFLEKFDSVPLSVVEEAISPRPRTHSFDRRDRDKLAALPKPWIYSTFMEDPILIKLINKCSTIKLYRFFWAIGYASEEVLTLLLDKKVVIAAHDMECVLYHGYSEEFVLKFNRHFSQMDSNTLEMARIRGYSDDVVKAIAEKCPYSCLIL